MQEFIHRPLAKCVLPPDWSRLPLKTQQKIFEYQKHAIERAIVDHNGRSVIAAGMGCGKTLMGLVFGFLIGGSILVLGPSGKTDDWIADHGIWIGPEKVQKLDAGPITCRVVVASYEMAKKHQGLLKHKWNVIVADECHYLKSTTSQRSVNLIPVLEKCDALLLLSGMCFLQKPVY